MDTIKTNREGLSALLFHWITTHYNTKALAESKVTLAGLYHDMHELNMGTLVEEHPFLIQRTLHQVQEFALDILTDY